MYYKMYTNDNNIIFEWDDSKELLNIKKHGVTFNEASYVFIDKNRIEYYDKKHSYNEERYITIGIANKILYVVYTVRNEKIRILSARIATHKEKEKYIQWVGLH